MSNQGNDKLADDKLMDAELTEPYLRGDSAYSKLYAKIESDDIPPELDRAVLAEAGAAIARRKGLTWQRLTPLLAVAATTILSVSIVLRSGQHLPSERPAKSDIVAVPKVSNVPDFPSVASVQNAEVVTVTPAAEPAVEAKRKAESAASKAAASPVPPPAAGYAASTRKDESKSKELDEVRVTGNMVRSTPEDVALPVDVISSEELKNMQGGQSVQSGAPQLNRAGPRESISLLKTQSKDKKETDAALLEAVAQARQANRVAGPRAPATASADSSIAGGVDQTSESAARALNPGVWLAYIRELRTQGKSREADSEWERFVKAYPNVAVDGRDAARPATKNSN